MNEAEEDMRYPQNLYGVNIQQHGYGASHSQMPNKFPVHNSDYPQPSSNHCYPPEEEEEEEEEEEDEGDEGEELADDEDEEDAETEVVSKAKYKNDDDDDDDDDEQTSSLNGQVSEDEDRQRHRKKRKLKSLISNYEFAPRVRASSGGRGSLTDWTEHETFVLLDEWGNRFLQLGRKSLRLEEWQEVAEKVSQVSKLERTDTQCRNRLDTLKKKYKKEKGSGASKSKWVYLKKMDMLMSSPTQQSGLSCGMDSGEYVFMNPKVYLSRANGLDEMRDSPGNSESSRSLPPPKRKAKTRNGSSSFQLLVDCVHKFSEIYEKIEISKRQQMVELEKMRMDFQRELELQRRHILEKAQAEIAKIRRGHDE